MPAARRERASAVKSSPAALRTNSGCFAQWQLRVRTTEGEGTSRRSTTSIAEMRAHPASATQPWPSPSTQQRDQSIERLQRQSKSKHLCDRQLARRHSSLHLLGELPSEMLERNRLCSVLLGALLPQTMLLADRGYDADRIRELSRQPEAWANIPPKRNRKDLTCSGPCLYRAELGCALMSPFPKICREFYRAFHP